MESADHSTCRPAYVFLHEVYGTYKALEVALGPVFQEVTAAVAVYRRLQDYKALYVSAYYFH